MFLNLKINLYFGIIRLVRMREIGGLNAMRRLYPNDLTNQEWDLIAPLVAFKHFSRDRKGITLHGGNAQCCFLSLEGEASIASPTSRLVFLEVWLYPVLLVETCRLIRNSL